MSDFEATKRWKVYLDEEARQQVKEIMPHLEDNYDGPSDFVQQKIMEEQPFSLEKRIERAEQDLEEDKERLEKLQRIKEEREQQEKLKELRSELKEKQNRLREAEDSTSMSKSEALDRAVEKELSRKPNRFSDAEYIHAKSRRVLRRAENLLNSSVDREDLRQEVRVLQERVAELNGGREDWFLELEAEGRGASA